VLGVHAGLAAAHAYEITSSAAGSAPKPAAMQQASMCHVTQGTMPQNIHISSGPLPACGDAALRSHAGLSQDELDNQSALTPSVMNTDTNRSCCPPCTDTGPRASSHARTPNQATTASQASTAVKNRQVTVSCAAGSSFWEAHAGACPIWYQHRICPSCGPLLLWWWPPPYTPCC
jgi:hypothetical protein